MNAPNWLIGATDDWKPIRAPKRTHSILFAAAGAGKTSAGVIPRLLSTVPYATHAIVITDGKSGEIFAQTAEAFHRLGRKVVAIDAANFLGNNRFKVRMSPFESILFAYHHDRGQLIFRITTTCELIIPEPAEPDPKNQYWRDGPRGCVEFSILDFLERQPHLLSPGAVNVLLSDPTMLIQAAKLASETASGQRAALAHDIVEMAERTPDLFTQHRTAAVRSLRIFGEGSILHDAGLEPETTFAQLIEEKAIIYLIGDQRNIREMGSFYAMELTCCLDAMYSGAGPVEFILDECTNTPIKPLVSAMTTMRGYGGSLAFIAQSLSEMQRAFGQRETETIQENSPIKQYKGVSSFEEARKLSEAIGEEYVLQTGYGLNSQDLNFSANYSTAKERIYTPEQLMRMPNTHQLVQVSGVGWICCRKVFQNQIAPFCHGMLADNPLEGPQRPADPKLTISW